MPIEDYYEVTYRVKREWIKDEYGGYEEKFIIDYDNPFESIINRAGTNERIIQAQSGVIDVFTVFIDKNIPLQYNDYIYQNEEYYRLNSKELIPPKDSGLENIKQFTAELIEILI